MKNMRGIRGLKQDRDFTVVDQLMQLFYVGNRVFKFFVKSKASSHLEERYQRKYSNALEQFKDFWTKICNTGDVHAVLDNLLKDKGVQKAYEESQAALQQILEGVEKLADGIIAFVKAAENPSREPRPSLPMADELFEGDEEEKTTQVKMGVSRKKEPQGSR